MVGVSKVVLLRHLFWFRGLVGYEGTTRGGGSESINGGMSADYGRWGRKAERTPVPLFFEKSAN